MYTRRFGEMIKPPPRPKDSMNKDDFPIRTLIPACNPKSLDTYLQFISDTFRIDHPFLIYQSSHRDHDFDHQLVFYKISLHQRSFYTSGKFFKATLGVYSGDMF
jgi:hypothetical protein